VEGQNVTTTANSGGQQGQDGIELLEGEAVSAYVQSSPSSGAGAGAGATAAAASLEALLERVAADPQAAFEPSAFEAAWRVSKQNAGAFVVWRAALKAALRAKGLGITEWSRELLALGRRLDAEQKAREEALRRAVAEAESEAANEVSDDDDDGDDGEASGGVRHDGVQVTVGKHAHDRCALDFRMRPGRIERVLPGSGGGVRVALLARFSARIVAELVQDDLQSEERVYVVEAIVGGRTRTIRVPASEFVRMEWVPTRLGSKATILDGGPKTRDQVRAAIQILSEPDHQERRVYGYTGWLLLEPTTGQRAYLHAGGALGAGADQAEVHLGATAGNLRLLRLPEPATGALLIERIHECLALFRLGPRSFTAPLYAVPWRAPLGDCHTVVLIQALPTRGKTTAALWMQNHFGTGFHMHAVPETWESTGFGIKHSLATAGDCGLLVDDLNWTGTDADSQKLKKCDEVVRAYFGGSSRSKGTADSKARKDRVMRALPVITSEFLPTNSSLLSRVVALTLAEKLPLTLAQIDELNRKAAAGVYASVMAAYILWVADRYDALRAERSARIASLRDRFFAQSQSARGAEEIAELAVGVKTFLDFAEDVGALSAESALEAWTDLEPGFVACARAQVEGLRRQDAGLRFFGHVQSLLASGEGYLTDKKGAAPEDLTLWGWKNPSNPTPGRHHLGYLEGERVYIHRRTAWRLAFKAAKESGSPLDTEEGGVTQRLFDLGLLAEVTKNSAGEVESKTVRVSLGRGKALWGFLAFSTTTFLRGPNSQAASDASKTEASPTRNEDSEES
jgi:hypothetical protein